MNSRFVLTIKVIVVFGLMLAYFGCGVKTKVTGSWSQYPEKIFNFNKIAVVGIAKRVEGRKIVEEEISNTLVNKGNNSVGGLDFLPPKATEENLPLDVLRSFLELEKADAVLTVSVLRTKDEKQYSSGSYYYAPWSDAPFGDYYGQMRNYLYAPSYTTVSTTFFLESNLYSFPQGELLWSAQTASSNVTDIKVGAQSLARTVVAQMITDKLIAEKK